MTDAETTRLVAWSHELVRVHAELRAALDVTRDALAGEDCPPGAAKDLLLYCHGFCVALNGHHRGEDRHLFPAVAAAHPQLRPVLDALVQDHSMIEFLLGGLQDAVDRSVGAAELSRHLEGIAAIMESHFRYEERQLVTILQTLDLPAGVTEALGPL